MRLSRGFTAGLWTGPVLTYNNGKFVWTYDDEEIEGQRSHTSLKWGLGGYIEFGPRAGWYGRLGAQHVSINSDADDHSGFNFSVIRDFRSGGPRFARPGTLPRSSTPQSSTGRPQR
jgi:hypothetical protein